MAEVRNHLTELCDKMDALVLQLEQGAKELNFPQFYNFSRLMTEFVTICFYNAQDGIDFTASKSPEDDAVFYYEWQVQLLEELMKAICPGLDISIKPKEKSHG